MTRDEAINMYERTEYMNLDGNKYYTDNAEVVISSIFNDIELETCERCKHCEIIERKFANTYHCTKPLKFMDLPKDFGCNQWEQK